jgi:hypothetical protein
MTSEKKVNKKYRAHSQRSFAKEVGLCRDIGKTCLITFFFNVVV